MTEQLKPCPLPDCGGEAEFESPVQGAVVRCKSCGIALAKELNPSLYTGYDALKRAEKRWVIDRWNTRPSASREIAVKPLTFSDEGYAHNGLGTMYRITFHNDANIGWVLYRHEGSSKTGLGAHEDRDELITLACQDNERRIRSAIDTTPGNTDPIAKDDELRKVQGRVQPDWEGFGRALMEDWPTGDIDGSHLFDMSLKYGLIAEIPGGYNPDEHIDAEGICPERGDPWYEYTFRSSPTEHPTEQPVYETCSKCSGSGQMIGDAGEPTLCSECKGDTVVASEQPSVRDVLSKAANDAIQGYAERTDRYASGFRNGIFTMRKSILRSLAQEGE